MENILDIEEGDGSEINASNAALNIWLSPKQTLEAARKRFPSKHIHLLFFLGGVGSFLDRNIFSRFELDLSNMAQLILVVFLGGCIGWLLNHVLAWALTVTGRWLKGEASQAELSTVLAWSLVPGICALGITIPAMLFIGDAYFYENYTVSNDYIEYSLIGIALATSVLSIWSFVIGVIGIKEIQNFKSYGRAVINYLLPYLLLFFIVAIFAFFFFFILS